MVLDQLFPILGQVVPGPGHFQKLITLLPLRYLLGEAPTSVCRAAQRRYPTIGKMKLSERFRCLLVHLKRTRKVPSVATNVTSIIQN